VAIRWIDIADALQDADKEDVEATSASVCGVSM